MNIDKKKFEKIAAIGTAVMGASFAGMKIIGKIKKGSSVYNNDLNQKNPLEGHKVKFVPD